MANPFEVFGAALGGDSEKAYQEGRMYGAKTEDALAAARERVEKSAAKQRIRGTARAAGISDTDADLYADVLTAGGNLGDLFGGLKTKQEIGLRERASNPNLSFSDRNIALQGVASAPVDRFQKIGRGVDDRFDEAGVQDLGAAFADSGSNSAQMQLLDRFGFPAVLADDAQKDLALSTLRDTFGVGDAAGVPFSFSKSPYRHGGPQPLAPGAAPTAASAPPPPPAAAPPIAPMLPTAAVADNARQIEAAKAQGSAQGKNAASLPTALNTIDTFTKDIDDLLASKGFDSIYGARVGTPAGQAAVTFINQDAQDAAVLRNKINAESFRASINSMRGLGQLSNAEGEKVQAALTTLADPHLSPAAARQAAQDLKVHLAELKRVAKIEAGQGGGTAPTGNDYSSLWK